MDLDYDFCVCNADGEGTTWYFKCPAPMSGHRVNLVHHFIEVNPDEPPMEIWGGLFHCVHCKLMGTEETMEEYDCSGPNEIDWMKECGCSQCKRGGEPCTWASVSMICHGG